MPRLMLHSAQMELPAERLGAVEVHFGRDIAPGGFAWAVPVLRPDGPSVRIGVMCEGAGRHFSRMLAAVAPRWGVTVPTGASRARRCCRSRQSSARTATACSCSATPRAS